MIILAFTDLHAHLASYKKIQKKIKQHKPDVILCCGDFTIFDHNVERMMLKLNELGKPLYLIHGNHEDETIVKKLSKNYPNIHFVHKTITSLGEYTLVAHGGGGFYDKRARDKDFDAFIREHKKKLAAPFIFMTHAPPANTELDIIWSGEHVGCQSYTEFITAHKPILSLCGHLHENFYLKQKLDKTLICNPGPQGMVFIV